MTSDGGRDPYRLWPDEGSDQDLATLPSRIAAYLGGPRNLPVDRNALRRIDAAVGPLLFPAWDEGILAAIELTGLWEPATTAWIQERLRPGASAVVVGANVGYHAIAIARAVGPAGKVIAFEPDPLNFELLRANLAFNEIGNVFAVPLAVGNSTGTTEFALDAKNAGRHRSYRPPDTPEGGVIHLPIVKLDDLLEGCDVDFVLSDTQTFDHRVISGLGATVARCKPLVLTQFWPEELIVLGDDPGAVIESYRSLGYDVGVVGNDSFPHHSNPASFAQLARGAPGGYLSLVLDRSSVGMTVDPRCAARTKARQLASFWTRAQAGKSIR